MLKGGKPMARCRECNFFEEDDELISCNHPYCQPSLFGFDIPEEIDCDGFERFYLQEESIIDFAKSDDIDLFLYSRGYR